MCCSRKGRWETGFNGVQPCGNLPSRWTAIRVKYSIIIIEHYNCIDGVNVLQDVRVVQRRLVYAVGLSADICSDQVCQLSF